MRYRLTVSYRGTAYAGWQWQANARSVQEVVEAALGDLAGVAVRVTAAGRTDAGVHARGQVIHCDLERPLPPGALIHGTNFRLPEDVRVLAASAVRSAFHARFDALAKEYRYTLVRAAVLSPLDAWDALRVSPRLDLAALAGAAAQLVGRHDFAAFALAGAAIPDGPEGTVRTLSRVECQEDGERITLVFVGEGFLRGMVRGLVGTLLEVARGRRTPEQVGALLTGAPRSAAGPTAPPHALCLERVVYASGWELDDP